MIVKKKIQYKEGKTQLPLKNKSVNKELESRLVLQRSNKGHPYYGSYYTFMEDFVSNKIRQFNSLLRRKYPFSRVKCSALLDQTNVVFTHYRKRFPENQYQVTNPSNKEEVYSIKPSCCANAFSIWSQMNKNLPKKQIIHEIADCYRCEKQGSVRSLSRNCYFTMPDYHMITTKEESLQDFRTIRSELIKLSKKLYGSLDNFVEMTRLINYDQKGIPLEQILFHEDNLDDVYYEKIQKVGEETPYYSIKWELVYCGTSRNYTLATVQRDALYPLLFELDETIYGPREGIHFSMGSYGRIFQTILLEGGSSQVGFKLVLLDKSDVFENAKKIVENMNVSCPILLDDSSKNLSEAIAKGKLVEQAMFSDVVLIGKEEKQKGVVTYIDRKNRTQKTIDLRSFCTIINSKYGNTSMEWYFTSTLE
jgi:threonyl-tRNA synthetase